MEDQISPESKSKLLKVAIVTGEHAYEVVPFHQLTRSLDGMDVYVQNLDNFVLDYARGATSFYDVVVFFNFHEEGPEGVELKWFQGERKKALEDILDSKTGIVMWHHGMLAFPTWSKWEETTGLVSRPLSVLFNETVPVEVVNNEHPITKGMNDWVMIDETYKMNNPSIGENEVLLRTSHSESMRDLAWTRDLGGKRCFVFQPGHDEQTWKNKHFKTVFSRGILWAAGRI